MISQRNFDRITMYNKRRIPMKLYENIKTYIPVNEQETRDKEIMLKYLASGEDCFTRENLAFHFTASVWTVNKAHIKTLMVYHNLYDSWSWIGGHADGIEDLSAVAMRELQEETGVRNAKLISEDIFSLEILAVNGHMKKGKYVPSHLHLNVTFLAEADENEILTVKEDENSAVKWWTFEEALRVSKEPWFVEHVYKKLIKKCCELG